MDELAVDVFEVQLSKSKINLNTSIVVGFAILQLAKLRMLEYYYDFMCKYFDKQDFEYVTMDTDSAYFAMSGSFEDRIVPPRRCDFFNHYDRWFVPPYCSEHKENFICHKLLNKDWLMKSCCKTAHHFHKRTPGLFKEEY